MSRDSKLPVYKKINSHQREGQCRTTETKPAASLVEILRIVTVPVEKSTVPISTSYGTVDVQQILIDSLISNC